MKLDDKVLLIGAFWSGISQVVISLISLILDIRRDIMSKKESNHLDGHIKIPPYIVTNVSIFFILAICGIVVYWVTILLSTSSQGTLSELVTRAATWATIIGLGLGFLIGRSTLNIITKRNREKNKDI